MSNPFLASDAGFIRLCGHRGHNVSAPENTIAAFRAAYELGATSLEIDTVLTADGEIVVLHDLLLDRTTNGTGAAKDATSLSIAALDAGGWFKPEYAGERVPTLTETLALAHELDIVLEVEIKEKVRLDDYLEALNRALANPADRSRAMMISFDHASLKRAKEMIPGLRTGGIVHERYADPVAVARISDLDELCIDLEVYDLEDAQTLHAAGIAIRSHAYKPGVWDKARRAGLDWDEKLTSALRAGLIDTLSGDDVGWLRDFRDAALK